MPTENKEDDNTRDPLNDDKVESGPINEGQVGGSGTNVEKDGTQVQPNTSSIKYSMPSIFTHSG
jgi:hypothetical protein